jgi:arabinofuranan 3-O-arabinosyltransferase
MTAGGRTVTLRPRGSVRAFDRGQPLRAVQCGGPVALGAGEQLVSAPPRGPFRVDLLELDSPAPDGVVHAAVTPGRVESTGTPGRGARSDIKLDVTQPAWLVLGESYSTGWRATCDGRSLGAPVALQGYAVAWPVDPGCRTVDIVFAGNRLVAGSALISLVASLALLGLIAFVAIRRRGALVTREHEGGLLPDPAVVRLSWQRALAWGVAAALAGGFVFALRAGVVIGPLVAFVLWRGIGARALSLWAGGLLAIAVPILYLVVPIRDRGGYSTSAPMDRIAAHWVAVAAIVLLILALYRTLAGVKADRARKPSTSTPSAATH